MKVLLPLFFVSLLSGCATPSAFPQARYVNIKDDHSHYSYTDNSVRSVTTNKSETHYHDKKKSSVLEEDEEFLQFKQEFKQSDLKLDGKRGSVNFDDLGF